MNRINFGSLRIMMVMMMMIMILIIMIIIIMMKPTLSQCQVIPSAGALIRDTVQINSNPTESS